MTTHLHRRSGAVAAAIGAMLALTACGAADESPAGSAGSGTATPESSTGSSTGSSPDPSAEPSPASSPTEMLEGSTEDSTGEASADAVLTVTDVRTSEQDGADRVELELDGTGTPGWHVGYVDEAFDEGKGDPVDVDGDAILQVHVTGTAMPMDSGVTEYAGDPVPGPDGGVVVTEVVYQFVLEGTTTAFVGVDGEPRPFTVTTQSDPTRLVIDVAH
ncbi:hypothetical protein ACNHYB_00460 [Isoptericola jiangsuensis]|uniref:AMIN-like domain-containing (lipo)protein n=1 Tax=Isoptericola jiangsuensis TaxID=548579 RepID=UPI003AAD576F